MKLIVDIPDHIYSMVTNTGTFGCYRFNTSKAIRQGIPLDKIISEIEQNAYPIVHGVNNHEKGMTLYGILQIIDKYKAERSDKE